MREQNILASAIDAAADRERLDRCAKKLMSQKVLLAWLLKNCTEEFSPYDISYIMNECIEGIPKVSEEYVNPDDCSISSTDGTEMITGMNTEDNTIKEGRRSYDIRFRAVIPCIKPVISYQFNVEIQNNDKPGYPITKRGTYYESRMISSQYGTVFTGDHYEKIEKVFTIWLCTTPAGKRKNSLIRYSTSENRIYGRYAEARENYDLMEMVILYLDPDNEKSEMAVINLFNTLFSSNITADEKKRILEQEYNIAMTTDIDEEVGRMCNYSEGVYNRGLSKGIEQGIERGIEQGIEQGSRMTTVNNIRNVMESFGVTIEKAMDSLKVPKTQRDIYVGLVQDKQ